MTLDELVRRYSLDELARSRLAGLLEALVSDPLAPTTVRDPRRALEDHLADSLVALELGAVGGAGTIADLGSGAGLPGLPLAIARPAAGVSLVEAARRKCEFLQRVVDGLELENVAVVGARAEELSGSYDVITVRAVSSLAVVAEYAAPLLRLGGTLVVWRGGRDPQAELEGQRAASELGLEVGPIVAVSPYPRAQRRHLHLMSKVVPTPSRFPRRPGMAAKRPLGRR